MEHNMFLLALIMQLTVILHIFPPLFAVTRWKFLQSALISLVNIWVYLTSPLPQDSVSDEYYGVVVC